MAIKISKQDLLNTIIKGYSIKDMAEHFNCSERTISRKISLYTLSLNKYTINQLDLIKYHMKLGRNTKDITDIYNIIYNTNKTESAITTLCYKYKWKPNYNILFKNFIIKLFKKHNHILLISKYVGSHKKHRFKCIKDNNTWIARPHDILQSKYGCPKCANQSRYGAYGNMTKEQADMLNYPLYLYKVKLQFKDEIFYKYGLTKNDNRSRFKYYSPYKVIEELSFEKYDAWTAICEEKELKSNYSPKYKFGGINECYNVGYLDND